MPGVSLEVRIDAKCVREPDGGTRLVLRDVRFAVEPGEFVALFGPSGIGKTTALRLALGLDRTFKGSVSPPGGRIGAVFQEPRLLPWLTVAENLRLVLPDRGRSIGISHLLSQVELSDVEQRYPRELSLGMARRVSLARALAVDPDVLVLDEPFASLDPALGARLATSVSNWARDRGATVLLATHDLDQTLAVASRVMVLAGTPATLAADITVDQRGHRCAIARLRATLIARFPF
ncbi:MAG: ABC transporter ATP-binding protein, partial [Acetobacteraceae bacterium]